MRFALERSALEAAGHHRGGRHTNDALLINNDDQVDHLGHRLAEG